MTRMKRINGSLRNLSLENRLIDRFLIPEVKIQIGYFTGFPDTFETGTQNRAHRNRTDFQTGQARNLFCLNI